MSSVILRKFWLENETGNSIPLNGEQGIWLIDPTGLGISSNSSFTNFNYGFFKPIDKEKDPQQTVAGDLYFIDRINPYVSYRRFADWITQSKVLYLVYQPTAKQYRRKVMLSSISKEELLTQECIKCPVAFYSLTPWFTIAEYTIELNEKMTVTPYRVGSSSQGRVGIIEDAGGQSDPDKESSSEDEEEPFPFDEEPLWLDGGGEDSGDHGDSEEEDPTEEDTIVQPRLIGSYQHTFTLELYSNGQMPAGFSIECYGQLLNPTISLKGSTTGATYGICSLDNTEISNSELLLYSSTFEDSYVVKRTGDTSISLLNSISRLDSNYIYPKIPIGEVCRLIITSDDVISTVMNVKMYEYYKGV